LPENLLDHPSQVGSGVVGRQKNEMGRRRHHAGFAIGAGIAAEAGQPGIPV
jgi:uncharacterized protein YycO